MFNTAQSTRAIGFCFLLLFLTLFAGPSKADQTPISTPESFVYGDALADAPSLAPRGPFGVGVRTVALFNPNQIDIVHATATNPAPTYDRPVTFEIWYPAKIPAGKTQLTTYTDCPSPRAGQPPPPVYSFEGRALRDALPDSSKGPYPLIVVSHGYPGSRVMMSNLTENLASKGYVVAAIDHADSTHFNKGPFPSTLLNRWSDITFTLDQIQSATETTQKLSPLAFLAGLTDVKRTTLIGYSMGGFGVLNVAGAGYSAKVQPFVGGLLSARLASAAAFAPDPRIKAVVAFAPWGGAEGVWDSYGLAGLKVPILFVDGDHDDVANYANGVKVLFNGAVNADRYLLVYENARHNIAPNPPPQLPGMDARAFLGYGEPAWDSRRINNVNQHFITAFLNQYIQVVNESEYLNLPSKPGEDDWNGFAARTAVGLELWHLAPGQSLPQLDGDAK